MSMRNNKNEFDDLMEDTGNLSDDDNAQPDMPEAEVAEVEDPLLLAIDDLEGRVVSALDEVKLHPGVRTSTSGPGSPSVHEELATLLRPVIEVAAHTGPSIARTYYREDVEASVEDVYQRVVSDLVLPVLLEMAQSERTPAKLAASLEFFRNLWKECQKAGSWLDRTNSGEKAGPYGAGGRESSHHSQQQQTPAVRAMLQRRRTKRLAREGELLRYWIQASIACTEPGVLTSEEGEGAVASRGVIAASASLRPALQHICQRIKDTDDRGANRLFIPAMRMVEGVFKQLFLGGSPALRSACIKFLEIVIMCCSSKPQEGRRRSGASTAGDFSLDDLPAGHPVITRESLESIAEYAFTTLRGLTLLGGQVKIDANLLSDILMGGGGGPAAQVVSILKPAALSFLEIESHLPQDDIDYTLDRASLEYDFILSQKSYAVAVNAVAALALHRPLFYPESALCLARRAVQPPVESASMTKSAVLAITSQLKSSCLTLLRNALSVTKKSHPVLHKALKMCDMEIQADKALSMAKQATALKTAGRAARNRANMYYEWDSSGGTSRRQRQTDDDLAQVRAAKKARGLGRGIQLPSSMTDSLELILANLEHLPEKRPPQKKPSKYPVSLDSVIDSILTNGSSLSHEEGHWYDRDGSSAWNVDWSAERYTLDPSFLETLQSIRNHDGSEKKDDDERRSKRQKIFVEQGQAAASTAMSRILTSSSNTRSPEVGKLGSQLASRLAFVLQGIQPSKAQEDQYSLARESVASSARRLPEGWEKRLNDFLESYPLVASTLVVDAMSDITHDKELENPTLGESVLLEAYMQSCDANDFAKYDNALAVYVAVAIHAGESANQKPSDAERKKIATNATMKLQKAFARLPRLTETSICILAGLCDIEEISAKAAAAQRQTSADGIAAAAATHAAKVAAEKRAKGALLILRDVIFQRDIPAVRNSAVQCGVGLAAGRLPASVKVQETALTFVVNVIFSKNEGLADLVTKGTLSELERASKDAIASHDKIQKANKEAEAKSKVPSTNNPLVPRSDDEKQAIERMRGPSMLCMALCLRKPELIQKLFEFCSLEKADVLSKTVRINMPKLAKASATKHGVSTIALKVAEMTGPREVPMLLSFLENLAPTSDRNLPDQDVIDACFKIQELKQTEDGKKDPRFIIPIVSAMLRKDLVSHLADFVAADDNIFLAALVRMGDRVSRQALLFREEPDEENPTVRGMTLCEQLVFLHRLDFSACALPQKSYLAAIKLCLEDEENYTDQVLMAALDQMSGAFLAGTEKLPLAFMRTCILVCSQHESLHSWICHELLPRLIDGKVYEESRQWEGWMRCAHMLENSEEPGVSSEKAISKLPPEQFMQYRTKWASE